MQVRVRVLMWKHMQQRGAETHAEALVRVRVQVQKRLQQRGWRCECGGAGVEPSGKEGWA